MSGADITVNKINGQEGEYLLPGVKCSVIQLEWTMEMENMENGELADKQQ